MLARNRLRMRAHLRKASTGKWRSNRPQFPFQQNPEPEMEKMMGSSYSLKEHPQSRVCVYCGDGNAALSLESQEFQYGNGPDAIALNADVPVWTCGACDLQFTDEMAETIRHNVVCDHLGRLHPDEVRGLREQHNLTQEQFAKLTGVGVASIRRWESGNLIQNEALDRYLRLLRSREIFRELQKLVITPDNAAQPKFRTSITKSTQGEALMFRLRPSSTLLRAA